MIYYRSPNSGIWKGRQSDSGLYLHEIVQLSEIDKIPVSENRQIGIIGYACDEGVRRNKGRMGTAAGPTAIRRMMAPLSNHLSADKEVWDGGDIVGEGDSLESLHEQTASSIAYFLDKEIFPLVLGGGHDLAYPHYRAIRSVYPDKSIGIINLDAHFDLRPVQHQRNSGTPFWQIAQEAGDWDFHYFCLGIQEESNNKKLFEVAGELGVQYMTNRMFRLENFSHIRQQLDMFVDEVDLLYLTVDMDGFSSSIAPGVSAPSPLGFHWDVAFATIEHLCASGKLVSADIVEMNPKYDRDHATARLAARVGYEIMLRV